NNMGYRTYYCGHYPGISGLGATEDGKIVLSGISFDKAGKHKILLMSFLPDGTPDSSFNHTGMLHTDLGFSGLPYMKNQAVLKYGKVVVSGVIGSPFVARFKQDGSLDHGFNHGTGYLILPELFKPKLLALKDEKT